MSFSTPNFWGERGWQAYALLPFAWLYDTARRFKNKHVVRSYQAPVPVLCIGGITAGGAGKTPLALYIGEWMKNRGKKAFFLSRGYGGGAKEPTIVDPSKHTASDVGDEPLMLALVLPTIVAADRKAGAELAVSQGAELIIMDDGLHNPGLSKTRSILVIDGSVGFGNGFLIPAGPLRAPVKETLGKVDALFIVNPTENFSLPKHEAQNTKPIFTAISQPVESSFVHNKRWVAFCGLAYPHKFFGTLHNLGGHVMATRSFADHYPYTPEDIASLKRMADAHGAQLITTAKDFVRLPQAHREGISVLSIELVLGEKQAFEEWLSSL
jgi:tetraacyldisaccharide 4'-kinase